MTAAEYKTDYEKKQWEQYHKELESHNAYYEKIKPDGTDEKVMREWERAKAIEEPNKPGYVIANND